MPSMVHSTVSPDWRNLGGSKPMPTPAGVGMGFDPPKFLQSGDVVECAIEGIGTLRSTVV